MEATLTGVAVARSFLEIPVHLEDRAVEVDRHRPRAADPIEHGPRRAAVDALELVGMAEAEGAQPLPRGGRRGSLDAVAQLPRDRLVAQHLKVAETVPTHHEVGRHSHHEILDRNAAPPLLDGQSLEIADPPELGGEVEYESQAGERGGVVCGGLKLDAAETRWDLHLTSAPSLERETSSNNASLPRLEHVFYASLMPRGCSVRGLPVDLGLVFGPLVLGNLEWTAAVWGGHRWSGADTRKTAALGRGGSGLIARSAGHA